MGGKRKITMKQERFSQYIISGLSATDAYKKAYPSSLKWKNATANIQKKASELQLSSVVAARIKQLREKTADLAVAAAQEVLLELKAMSLVNVADCLNKRGELRPIKKWPKALQRAVVGIEYKTVGLGDGVQKIVPVYKFAKAEAIDKLMRHLGQYKDNAEVGGIDLHSIQVIVQQKINNHYHNEPKQELIDVTTEN